MCRLDRRCLTDPRALPGGTLDREAEPPVATLDLLSGRPMRLPPGNLFFLDGALPQPELREFHRLDLGGGREAEVLFTREKLARDYADALPGNGWEITAMKRKDVLVFLVESYQMGVTSAAIDPRLGETVKLVHIFRILVESG
jgi:hypothetical protein